MKVSCLCHPSRSLSFFPPFNSFFYLENTFCVYTTYPESILFYFFPAPVWGYQYFVYSSPSKKRRKTKWERNFFFRLFASLFCLLRSSSVNKYCRGDWRHTRRWLDHKRERPGGGGGCGRSLKGRGEVIRRCVLTTRFTSTSNGKQPLWSFGYCTVFSLYRRWSRVILLSIFFCYLQKN